ncbi:gamma-glutamylcyclotransferase family protein [Aspergillus thermomutatus]|uniref:gamma-glutamylcyclotransferase n=1 Tax=Aspergillus thermomutatus TaxID=41047 RepID=A0A397GWC2_ASPTH|nr:uncharacterized protein CDV56_100421 [Aspergillus thermomutatus]RHZ53363.1 hypothetical protein CDV56_100421 [Aspergillus thermomutatus]
MQVQTPTEAPAVETAILKESITTTVPVTETPPPTLRPLYFAYGSNLSFTQMRLRCTHNPTLSSKPVAIARLDHWRWMICQAGYANVLPPAELRIGRQFSEGGEVPVSGSEDAVFGVLYEMDPADELLLDGYEGVDHAAGPSRVGGKVSVEIRPREQGVGDYNKWYLPATVTRWLDEEQRVLRMGAAAVAGSAPQVTTVLVYVDEERVRLGYPKDEYIPRMNRAIREAESIGFPKHWANEVMRKSIPLN